MKPRAKAPPNGKRSKSVGAPDTGNDQAIKQVLSTCQGILRLAHDFSPARLEAACERALALKASSYRAVRTLIQTPTSPLSSPSLDLAHENVRGAKYFQ